MNLDGHRGDLVILKTARAQASFEWRAAITPEDIYLASLLAIPHRLRRHPFDQVNAVIEFDSTIREVIDQFIDPYPFADKFMATQVRRPEIHS